eukprot:SAG11_NODE_3842_length_2193_cov_3.589780_1_plen_61_part_00
MYVIYVDKVFAAILKTQKTRFERLKAARRANRQPRRATRDVQYVMHRSLMNSSVEDLVVV